MVYPFLMHGGALPNHTTLAVPVVRGSWTERDQELKVDRTRTITHTVLVISLLLLCVAVCFIHAHIHPSPGPIILSAVPILLFCLLLSFGAALLATSARFATADTPGPRMRIRNAMRCQRWCDAASYLTKILAIVAVPMFVYFIRSADVMLLFIHTAAFLLWLFQKHEIKRNLQEAIEKSAENYDGAAPECPEPLVTAVSGPEEQLQPNTQLPERAWRLHPGGAPATRSSRPSSTPRPSTSVQIQHEPTPSSGPSAAAPPPSYAEVVDDGAGARPPSPAPSTVTLPPSYSQTQLAPEPRAFE